jgi:uncharacterized protein
MMIPRLLTDRLRACAQRFPVVVVLGARQVGKTTLARAAFPEHSYRDLEDPRTAARFADDPRFELDASEALILDEAQAVPSVFNALRGAIDAQRQRHGRFVVLGSAQPALVRGISESLAGRAAVIELDPLTAVEASQGDKPKPWRELWLKGGFPDALLGDSREWWEAYLRLLFERDLPQYGVRADPLFMRRLITMLAHQQGGLFNASALASSLGVSVPTVIRYVDVLEAVYLLRRLTPYFRNVGKRLTKSPKVYLRDTGLLHHLLNISSLDELASHPCRGASWEGFVIEDVLRRERVAKGVAHGHFWRTAAGAEVDLVIDRGHERVAIEIKAGRGDDVRAVGRLGDALPDIGVQRAWVVDQVPGIEALSTTVARAGFDEVVTGVP